MIGKNNAIQAPLDDQRMALRAREMAIYLRCDGKARISGPRAGQLSRALRALREAGGGESAEAAWFAENGRLLEAMAEQPPREKLPAQGGIPRVQRLMRETLCHSDGLVREDRLLSCVKAFCEVRELTMGEVWLIPAALKAETMRLYLMLARQTLAGEEERARGAKWAMDGGRAPLPQRPSPAFLERAMTVAREAEDEGLRAHVEAAMVRLEIRSDFAVRSEYERQALLKMYLSNAMTTLRMLENLDWKAHFARVSGCEERLTRDPSGTYPRMDDDSRTLVRREVARLAKELELKESTVAEAAVEAAETGEGIRRETCYWLWTDEGRRELAKRLKYERRLPRRIPDPDGRKLAAAHYILCGGWLAAWLAAGAGPAAALLSLPLGWAAVEKGLRALPMCRRGGRLLKMRVERVPEEWRALVALPALLSGPEAAEEVAGELHALACLSRDENIDFLLLGDLPEGKEMESPEDEAILAAARAEIERANGELERPKCYFLHRPRALNADGIYAARERKRGALEALNARLLGLEDGFLGRGPEGNYTYVITLDVGTRLLPDALTKMIGAMAHPLNQDYALMQPRMEAEAARTPFARLLAGPGGCDTYDCFVSEAWQSAAGLGAFGGKGIYRVDRLYARLEGKIAPNTVLSHDLLEGIYAGCGYLGDVTMYEGFPGKLSSWLGRAHRWIRGDWQLIPYMARVKSPAGRCRMAGNLICSLRPASLLAAGMAGTLAGDGWALCLFAMGFLMEAWPFAGRGDWLRAGLRLALLPAEAINNVDAIARALWRTFVSHKRMLEWKTARDTEKKEGGVVKAPFLLAAAGMAAGWPWGAPLCALWAAAPWAVKRLEKPREEAGQDFDREEYMEIARATWRYFQRAMGETGLPCDNIQVEPACPRQGRTSPTNMGLYVAACAAAWRLGVAGREEALERAGRAVETLERLEKWEGNLYNWYDADSGRPLEPKYISSVDGGNLAASLLCAAGIFAEIDGDLARRMTGLALEMELEKLFDGKRKLFYIGVDGAGRPSDGRYDLLASEARILYYVSAMLGKTPCESWKRLSRAKGKVGRREALLSWSGTMFEYLMPDLFLPATKRSLLGQTRETVIQAQERRGGPFWGVSESGYFALDGEKQYQYRAFGLDELALRGSEAARVYAPYASILACEYAPERVARNIRDMKEKGMLGELGLYEAMDGENIVKSHMSHHQGMILLAICNLLTGGAMRESFMKSARARSVSLLLEEKPMPGGRLPKRARWEAPRPPEEEPVRRMRCAYGAGGHLLYGGGTTLFLTSTGAGFCMNRGVMMNRRGYDRDGAQEGFFTHVRAGDEEALASGDPRIHSEAVMEAGCVEVTTRTERMETRLRVCVSPEDGALCRMVTVKNRTQEPLEVEIGDGFAVALSPESAYNAHPAFQNLFVSSQRMGEKGLLFARTPRSEKESWPALIYVTTGDGVEWETDLTKLTGRRGDLSQPGAMAEKFSGSLGYTLNPCAALRVKATIPGDGEYEAAFTAALLPRDQAEAAAEKYARRESGHRALELARTQSLAMLRFLGLDGRLYKALQKASAELAYPACRDMGSRSPDGEEDMRAEELWKWGISGELPILLCEVTEESGLARARELTRAHGFYRAMGLWCDLALAYREPEGYHRPLKNALEALTASDPNLAREPGGAHLIDLSRLDEREERLLRSAAAMCLSGDEPLASQWRRSLKYAARERLAPAKEPEQEAEEQAKFGFAPDGAYEFCCAPEHPLPAPWVNICANEEFGMMLSERGGGFLWAGSSRWGRLTPYENDPVREGFSQRFYIEGKEKGRWSLYPMPGGGSGWVRERYEPGLCQIQGERCGLQWTARAFVPREGKMACWRIEMKAEADFEGELRFEIDWLMSVHPAYRRLTRVGRGVDYLWARGGAGTTAFAQLEGGRREDSHRLKREIHMKAGETLALSAWVGCAQSEAEWKKALKDWRAEERMAELRKEWRTVSREMVTPDMRLNAMLNIWLPCQTRMSRLRGKTGFYQPGGAIGFRDQLQDMLPLVGVDDEAVRAHILLCAAHQFQDGDAQHWWHPQRLGVRTRISDDMLFLPYVTARYVSETGDKAVLDEEIPFLRNVEIPAGEEDWYGDPGESGERASLREHCLRAIRRACRFGEHGLALMGGGDWNDGMNRVGRMGRGESVWLSEFLLVVMNDFLPHMDEESARRCREAQGRLKKALEAAWDGEWYLRAYDDDGRKLGSRETEGGCQIDSICQSWAVLAGLRHGKEAMEAVERRLIDGKLGLIRLLDPPFGSGDGAGYICAYPPGVRENGGQYTHAACWVVMAYARLGEADKAWRLLQALMPYSHAETEKQRNLYRVEPYVAAGDIYALPPMAGRGGWTWYTGAAAWLCQVALRELLGYECRNGQARLNALLPESWQEVGVTLRKGGAEYRLLTRKNARCVMLDGQEVAGGWIGIADDGKKHTAVFPPRNEG